MLKTYTADLTLDGAGAGSVTLFGGRPISGEIKMLKIVGDTASVTISLITSRGRTIFTKAAYDSTTAGAALGFALMQPAYTAAFVATTVPIHVPQALASEIVVLSAAAGGAGKVLEITIAVEG